MSLLKEVTNEVDGVEPEPEVEAKADVGPASPDGWSVGHLANHGVILSCDGFQLRLDLAQLNLFFDIAEDGEPGEIKDERGTVVLVEPTDDSIVLTRTGDTVYPNGVTIDLDTLKDLGVEQNEEDGPEDQEEQEPKDDTIDQVEEAVHRAYRRAGGKIKRGFRVTSGYRKGRVVANISTAYKPRAKASTRMKLSIAGRKRRVIRVLKSKRTRKKSLSKRLARMNKNK